MQIHRYFNTNKPALALAIGNFDGLHHGHQQLLSALVNIAKQRNESPAVMTFEPHPREFFTPQQAPARLSSLREKLEYFYECGIEDVFIVRFNKHFASVTAEMFMREILTQKLRANTVMIGEDFRFGAKRQGGIDDLRASGFHVPPFPNVIMQDERISSTLVRQTLAEANFEKASKLLGRPYSISGTVVHGAKRGRQLGFPTANVHMRHERPAFTGVYAVKLDDLHGVANLGVRPTIGGVPKLMLEVHVIDFNGDLYGKHVHVQFLKKLRDEMRFENLAALSAQIKLDVAQAKTYFSALD